jgi:cytochrome P450/NADPH-cytochrome P450 reductase
VPGYVQIQRLTYISQVLKETLRLWPTAPAFSVCPLTDTVIGGRYHVKQGQHILLLLPVMHRDPRVWGQDADVFNPDRFAGDAEQHLPPHSYKPFGSGQRACIGRQFALHEAMLVLALLLQRFELSADPTYTLKIRESMTVKPEGFRITARPRAIARAAARPVAETPVTDLPANENLPTRSHGTRLLVLFGSNMGTAEELARRVAADGRSRGFDVSLAPLDDYAGKLPDDGLLAIVCASYNGNPPDNAGAFCKWLDDPAAPPGSLSRLRYVVFGCGHRDWATTFQAVPRRIDHRLTALGARRMSERGEGDAADDFDGQFLSWYRPLWDRAAEEFGLTLAAPAPRQPALSVDLLDLPLPAAAKAVPGAMPVRITANRELQHVTSAGSIERSTRHIEIELPQSVSYRAGDHLGVIPENDVSLVGRIASHFGLTTETWMCLRATDNSDTFLPVGKPMTVGRLLACFVELQVPATRSQIAILADHTACPHSRAKLLAWSGTAEVRDDSYQRDVLTPRKSVFDLLCEFRACTVPFHVYLEMLPPLAPRYYSISSSPLPHPKSCSITVGVLDAPARSGNGGYRGVCSNHLAGKSANEKVIAFVRDTKSPFRLPPDATVPLIMVGAGTGLAPYRGFLQERLAMMRGGNHVGPSLLFFGCRHPDHDFLYADELHEFESSGITRMYPAFSRHEGCPKTWVQDRILQEQDKVWAMLQAGATIYVCGDSNRMAPAVRQAFGAVYRNKTGATSEEAERWLTELATGQRYLVDVWPSN